MPDNNCSQKFSRFIDGQERKLNAVNFTPNFGSISILTLVIKFMPFCLIIINKKTIYS